MALAHIRNSTRVPHIGLAPTRARGVTFQTVMTLASNDEPIDLRQIIPFSFQAQPDGSKPLGAHGKDLLYDTPVSFVGFPKRASHYLHVVSSDMI
jgi:hypothetical protein